jgi:hypothetical protein
MVQTLIQQQLCFYCPFQQRCIEMNNTDNHIGQIRAQDHKTEIGDQTQIPVAISANQMLEI